VLVDGGTLLLDEIGDLRRRPCAVETRFFEPIGGT